ncbi:MAG: cell division protein FtsA, partial [Parabacteroides sp.]|nr:cell division protein FtsA [Parabacteroides sp.]
RFKMDVRYASVRKDFIKDGEMIANNPEYTTATALLLKGTENCAQYIEPKPEVKKLEPVVPEPPIVKLEPKVEEEVVKENEPVMDNPSRATQEKRDLKGNNSDKKKKGWWPTFFEQKIDEAAEKFNKVLKEEE